MSADIHPLPAEADMPVAEPDTERSVYLDAYLEPFREWLDCDTITEILGNSSGSLWNVRLQSALADAG